MMASLREMASTASPTKGISRKSTMRAVEIRSNIGSSFLTVSLLTLIGQMSAPTPISSSTLIILLPITLPSSMSVEPEARELMETASSGALVPKATIVRPIKVLLTLKLVAMDDAPSTSQSAPLIKIIKPMISNATCKIISICLF